MVIYRTHQRLRAVRRHHLPHGDRPRKGRTQTIVAAILYQIIMLLKQSDLLPDLRLLRFRHPVYVEFIPEGARHRHASSRGEGCDPACLMVRNRRNMGSHRAYRIPERGAVLYFQPFDRIRIVTAPYLRRIVQHTRVEPSASSTAPFKQNMRKYSDQLFQNTIQAQHKAMRHFTLPLLWQSITVFVAYTPVKIPFHIGDRRLRKNGL